MPKKQTIFITGIGTEVGKTICSAITVKTLEADYWKPIQSGDLGNSDTMKVKTLVGKHAGKFHEEAFRLTQPMSPHISAALDGVEILASKIQLPKTENNLVIEGAGGLLVPINETETITDLIPKEAYIILVSRNYLGSINHTLLSVEYLKSKGFKRVGILFNGDEVNSTQDIITTKTQFPILGRVPLLKELNPSIIEEQAGKIKENLADFLSSA